MTLSSTGRASLGMATSTLELATSAAAAAAAANEYDDETPMARVSSSPREASPVEATRVLTAHVLSSPTGNLELEQEPEVPTTAVVASASAATDQDCEVQSGGHDQGQSDGNLACLGCCARGKPSSRILHRVLIATTIVLFLACASLLLLWLLTLKDEATSDTTTSTTTSTPVDMDMNALYAPRLPVDEYYEYLYNHLSKKDITGLLNPLSPTYEALEWLAFQDGTVYQLLLSSDDNNNSDGDNNEFIATRIDQRFALLVLSFATTSPNLWSNWVQPGQDECQVNGILCSSNNNASTQDENEEEQLVVTALELQNRAIGGQLPNELNLLSNLVSLDLQDNRLEGSLPSTWLETPTTTTSTTTNMPIFPYLKLLDLNNNRVSGPLPTNLDQVFPSLIQLNIFLNNFQGPLPKTIPTSLDWFQAPLNDFSGTIPWDTWFNPGAGAGEQEQSNAMRILDLAANFNLSGTLPDNLPIGFPAFFDINLSETNIAGTIPSSLGQLTRFRNLFLRKTKISGSIPAEVLWGTPTLSFLVVADSQLTGSLPAFVNNGESIPNYRFQQFVLLGNQLTGTIPTELGYFTNLMGLQLAANDFTGTIPTELGKLSNLERLWIEQTDLVGTVPDQVCQTILESAFMFDIRRSCKTDCTCCVTPCIVS